jgi:type VI secretion system secreted protein Hcp
MAGNAFIRFKKSGKEAPGESTQVNFENWVEIGDWSWDIEAESSFTKGSGAAVGKAVPGSFSFTHFFDTSSPVIMGNIVKGVHFDSVEVVMLKQVGDGELKQYFKIQMKHAFTTKVSTKGGEDGSVSQDFELVAKEIMIEYKPQENSGEIKKSAIPFYWNIATNSIEGSLPDKLA